MRMIAGCLLILAGAVLYAAHWLGRVIQHPTTAGSPDAMYLLAAAVGLGLFGAAFAGVGLTTDRYHENPPGGKGTR
jgi:hypothetical protein